MTVIMTILAGVVGTAAMSLFMSVVHRAGWANADMIRALGSCVTRSYENSLGPGLLMHFASGAAFAFPYALVLSGLGLPTVAGVLGAGALIGFVHGFAMSFLLVAAVSERHPVPRFRTAGFEVAAAHIAGHVAYGIGVGAAVGLLAVDYGFRF